MKVPIFGGFPVENPTKEANRLKALLRGVPLSEYGLEGFRVRLRRLSRYGSVAYLVERPTRETLAEQYSDTVLKSFCPPLLWHSDAWKSMVAGSGFGFRYGSSRKRVSLSLSAFLHRFGGMVRFLSSSGSGREKRFWRFRSCFPFLRDNSGGSSLVPGRVRQGKSNENKIRLRQPSSGKPCGEQFMRSITCCQRPHKWTQRCTFRTLEICLYNPLWGSSRVRFMKMLFQGGSFEAPWSPNSQGKATHPKKHPPK